MNDTTQVVEQIALNGRFTTPTLLIAGSLLAIIVVLLTWWGSRWARRPLPALIALRVIAIGVLVWMLAEPVVRTTTRRTRAKSIVVMADASASMRVTDPTLEPSQMMRWLAIEDPQSKCAFLQSLDGARYALSTSRDRVGSAWSTSGEKPDLATLHARLEDARRWLEIAGRELAQAPDAVAHAALGTVDEFVRPKLSEVLADAAAGRIDVDNPNGANAGEVVSQLDEIVADLDRAAVQVAADLTKSNDPMLRAVVQQHTAASRQEKVSTLLNRLESGELAGVAKKAQVQRYYFDREVSPTGMKTWKNLEPRGGADAQAQLATDLGAALEQAYQDAEARNVEAVVIFTDGGHNGQTDPVQVASGRDASSVPTYLVPIGTSRPVRDVALHHVQAPRSVIEKDMIRIDAMIDAYECGGESLNIKLLQGGTVVDQQTVNIPTNNWFSPVSFERKAEALGQQEFQIVIDALPDEQVADNNDSRFQVEVTESTVRVLLADNLPRWEFRYLRNLFKRDQHVEFASVLMDPGQVTGTAGDRLPDQLDDWARYRVVILGDLPPEVLTPQRQAQLRDYVTSRGGTLVLIAGSTAMPRAYIGSTMEPLLPIEPVPFKADFSQGAHIVPTIEGRTAEPVLLASEPLESEQIWSKVPPIYDVSPFCLPRQTSHVWLNLPVGAGPTQAAFLCWHQVGKGRVAYLSSPSTYRLRFHSGDTYHHRFWGQFLRWAIARDLGAGSDMVRIVTDKLRYQRSEPAQVMVRLADARGQAVTGAVVLATARRDQQVLASVNMTEDADTPGLYRAVLKELPVGKVTVGAGGDEVNRLLASQKTARPAETEITVEPPLSLELRDTRCNLALLSTIAAQTHGAVLPPTAVPTLIRGLNLDPQVTEEVRTQPIWPRWSYMSLLVGALCLEWAIRKLTGLV